MSNIRLTPEEIWDSFADKELRYAHSKPDITDKDEIIKKGNKIAKAQIKKIHDWGEEWCLHFKDMKYISPQYRLKKHECPDCWKELSRRVNHD